MQLLIMRHGTAENMSAKYPDPERPLTAEGIQEVHKAGSFLARQNLALESLHCSPYTRARQTAEIIASHLAVKKIEIDAGLVPHGAVEDMKLYLSVRGGTGTALVTHQPFMGLLLAQLVESDPDKYRISPATFALLELPPIPRKNAPVATLTKLVRPDEIDS